MKNTKLLIYLADLVYDTIQTNYTIPLNVGYLAAQLKNEFPDDIDIKLFKYPKELEEAIRKKPPAILGLSNYSWNIRLSTFFAQYVKKISKKTITVMGGPNVRTDAKSIHGFLENNLAIDYYIIHEGEDSLSKLIYQILNGINVGSSPPPGCSTLTNGNFIYSRPGISKGRNLDFPSPYLTGLLDSFLQNKNIVPLLETNRGCPFSCQYCAWGISALSKVRVRDISTVYDEIDYIAEHSIGQLNWIVCDANFGILPRDVDIARKLRSVIDSKGYPLRVTIWNSKNTGSRNIEIAEILGMHSTASIALQSTDQSVLNAIGRGNIKFEETKKQIRYYKKKNMPLHTDILIGLPGETAESHMNTLFTAFDMGFDVISPYNIRMLPGAEYETEKSRAEFRIETKYRPIFGAYGIYDGQKVFELEESIRATKDMTETELNSFKALHWLIYFCWNVGILKPLLLFGQRHGVNPAKVLFNLLNTENVALKNIFDRMNEESMKEWHSTPEEMIRYYSEDANYTALVKKFVKLNFMYIALVYQDANILTSLQEELVKSLSEELKLSGFQELELVAEVIKVNSMMIPKDLLQGEFSEKIIIPNEIVSILFHRGNDDSGMQEVEIYRPKQFIELCKYKLLVNGKEDLSLTNLTRFLELGGMPTLMNKVRMCDAFLP